MPLLISRRSLLVGVPAAMAAATFAPVARAQDGVSRFGPLNGFGPSVLSEVYVAPYDYGDGEYEVEITVVPLQDEMDYLMSQGDENPTTHVDLHLTFSNLDFSGRDEDFWAEVNPKIRKMTETVTQDGDDTIVNVLGLKIPDRWEAGVPFTVYAGILGATRNGPSPKFSATLEPSTWWTATGDCTIDFERDSDGDGEVDEFFCSKQERVYAHLIGPDGRETFRFWR